MVRAVRQGQSLRSVARRFRVSLATVQRWVERAEGQRLDRADFRGAPRGGRRPSNSTGPALEDRILQVRRYLKEQSDLGEHGAAAIRDELLRLGVPGVPSARTIGRVL